MKKISLGVLVAGMVLFLGMSTAGAQGKPLAGGMGPGMMGPGMMMGGPTTGRCGQMMGAAAMKGAPVTGGCGCGMMAGPMKGRCGCGMMAGPMKGGCGCGMTGMGVMNHGMGMKGRMGMSGMHHRLWHYVMQLDLEQKQKTDIWKIRTDLMKKMIRNKADLRIDGLELGQLLHADKVDMKKVEAKVKKMEGLRSSMLLSGIEATEAVKSKLTAEQRKELDDMMDTPVRCMMTGDDMMSGGMSDEDITGGNDVMGGDGMMEGTPPFEEDQGGGAASKPGE